MINIAINKNSKSTYLYMSFLQTMKLQAQLFFILTFIQFFFQERMSALHLAKTSRLEAQLSYAK